MASLEGVKSGMMKGIKVTSLVVLLLTVISFCFFYFGTFSEGVRAGVVMKVSKRGFVFKTYEGQLNIQSFGAVKSSNQLSETFEFSIEKEEQDIIKILEEVSLTGERINLNYKERYFSFPWRGETKYFVTSVSRRPNVQEEIEQPVQDSSFLE